MGCTIRLFRGPRWELSNHLIIDYARKVGIQGNAMLGRDFSPFFKDIHMKSVCRKPDTRWVAGDAGMSLAVYLYKFWFHHGKHRIHQRWIEAFSYWAGVVGVEIEVQAKEGFVSFGSVGEFLGIKGWTGQ